MEFADIHNHALSGVDDGAPSQEIMYQMIDAAYADGTRYLCLTPHFPPLFFGDNRQATLESFRKLREYAAERYPQLRLYLGNELRYTNNCDNWLREGLCRTLDGDAVLLVDFPLDAEAQQITRGLTQLLGMGYQPILAHAERYSNFSVSSIRKFISNGIRIQVNAGSLFSCFGLGARLRALRLIRNRLVCIIASDAHDLHRRPPVLSKGYQAVMKITDKDYADRVFYYNALALLENNQEGLVKENE